MATLTTFHNDPDYYSKTVEAFKPGLQTVEYTWTAPKEAERSKVSQFFSKYFYNPIHHAIGQVVVPAADPHLWAKLKQDTPNKTRASLNLETERLYKRLTVKVLDGEEALYIDAMILGTDESLTRRNWILGSFGNADCYERNLCYSDLDDLRSGLNYNVLAFNNVGVGDSLGKPNAKQMAKVYQAMLSFLEDQENGVGAKTIIGFGHSLGAGVQSEALKTHTFKEGITYKFSSKATFSYLGKVVAEIGQNPLARLVGRIAHAVVDFFGWNLNTTESSERLERLGIQEVIVTCTKDEIIRQKASHAGGLKDPYKYNHKTFISSYTNHNAFMSNDAMQHLIKALRV